MKQFVISAREAGQRMDKYVFKVLDKAPHGFVYKMMRKKNIVLNEKKASGMEILQAEDVVKFYLADDTFAKFASGLPEDGGASGCANENVVNSGLKKSSYGAFAERTSVGKKEDDAKRNARLANMRGESRLQIIYEDTDILVINKPAGMLSQKAKPKDISANEYIMEYLLQSGQLREAELRTFRPSVCNRLDRNTSGLLIAGKTMHGLQEMARLLKTRTVKKFYLALVVGDVSNPQHLTGYLKKNNRTNQVEILSGSGNVEKTAIDSGTNQVEILSGGGNVERAAIDSGTNQAKVQPDDWNAVGLLPGKVSNHARSQTNDKGDYIETAYVPIAHFGGGTLLEVHLITGRSHQIRAHLSSIGHPILGDPKYGNVKVNRRLQKETGIRRQLLHAYRMEFPDGKVLTADVPEDFYMAEQWLQS